MRIALILPSNVSDAPYLKYYTSILDNLDVKYEIIYWNKLNISENLNNAHPFNYKCDYNSNILNKSVGYYFFSMFVKRIILKEDYNKLIIFVPQLAIFLKGILEKKYKKNYLLDIRDYGKANKYMKRLEEIIKQSAFTVISSPGYKRWLPQSYDYVISHNTLIGHNNVEYDLKEEMDQDLKSKSEIIISNIGFIRNFDENCEIIDSFSKAKKYRLNYIGKGACETELESYCNKNNIANVSFYGRYKKEEELGFYHNSDIINIITPKNKLGNHSAMANRFYNACISKRPMLVTKGSYMGEMIQRYNLGVELDLENENILDKVESYINNFDFVRFSKGCDDFLEQVKKEQRKFIAKVTEFIYQ